MLSAIIAAIIALIVVVAILVVLYVVLRGRKTENVSVKRDVRSIQSVGVKSSLPDSHRVPAGGVARGASPAQPVANPADSLKSRFVAVGILAGAIFGTLATKLWSMQVLSGDAFKRESEDNQYTTVYTPAPRGYILDADGNAIVKNRTSLTVLADPDVADDHDVVARLSTVLGVPDGIVRKRIKDSTSGAQSQRVVASDASMRNVAFIAEHADAFPGITVQTRTVRDYPHGALAAHAVGYTGSVTADDVASVAEGRDLELGDAVGRSGVEQMYDNLLAGDHGERKVMADAQGNVVEVVSETQPVKGSDVYLTLKSSVQYAADKALADTICPDGGAIGSGKGTGGAVVVMDVTDGSIVALSSYPTFTPSTFVGGITQDELDLLQSTEAFSPLLNRAVQGTYPAASTYKAFTGLAALENGMATADETWTCTGEWDGFNSGDVQKCWKEGGHGTLDLRGGIVNSCDVVFYDIGYKFWDAGANKGKSATLLQDFLKKYRLDQTTGIDLSGEAAGRIPTPEWKAEYFRDTPEDAQWKGGDYTNMCIGQGYVLVTPLEIAVGYGALASGNIVKPHLLKEVRNAAGDVALTYQSQVVDTPDVSMSDLAVIRNALRGVTTDTESIAKLFNEQGIDPETVACKTGTAEYTDMEDTAWFACYAPYDNPKYVAACLVEHGGGGSAVAGPIAAKVMAAALASDSASGDVGTIEGSSGRSLEGAGKSTSGGRSD